MRKHKRCSVSKAFVYNSLNVDKAVRTEYVLYVLNELRMALQLSNQRFPCPVCHIALT